MPPHTVDAGNLARLINLNPSAGVQAEISGARSPNPDARTTGFQV